MVNGYKKWFVRGLAALLPTLITLMIFIEVVKFVNNNFGRYIGIGITQGIGWVWKDFQVPAPDDVSVELAQQGVTLEKFSKADYDKKYSQTAWQMRQERLDELGQSGVMVLVGFILALMVVLVLGKFLASFMGRKLWKGMESALMRVPLVRQIYPYVKQVTDYVFGEQKLEFSHVVAVPYPRQGIWSVGFITGAPIRAIQDAAGVEYVTVFVPSSPTPVTGYVITVRKDEVLDLPLTIDQAFRFLISGGVINPETVLLTADSENNESEK